MRDPLPLLRTDIAEVCPELDELLSERRFIAYAESAILGPYLRPATAPRDVPGLMACEHVRLFQFATHLANRGFLSKRIVEMLDELDTTAKQFLCSLISSALQRYEAWRLFKNDHAFNDVDWADDNSVFNATSRSTKEQ